MRQIGPSQAVLLSFALLCSGLAGTLLFVENKLPLALANDVQTSPSECIQFALAKSFAFPAGEVFSYHEISGSLTWQYFNKLRPLSADEKSLVRAIRAFTPAVSTRLSKNELTKVVTAEGILPPRILKERGISTHTENSPPGEANLYDSNDWSFATASVTGWKGSANGRDVVFHIKPEYWEYHSSATPISGLDLHATTIEKKMLRQLFQSKEGKSIEGLFRSRMIVPENYSTWIAYDVISYLRKQPASVQEKFYSAGPAELSSLLNEHRQGFLEIKLPGIPWSAIESVEIPASIDPALKTLLDTKQVRVVSEGSVPEIKTGKSMKAIAADSPISSNDFGIAYNSILKSVPDGTISDEFFQYFPTEGATMNLSAVTVKRSYYQPVDFASVKQDDTMVTASLFHNDVFPEGYFRVHPRMGFSDKFDKTSNSKQWDKILAHVPWLQWDAADRKYRFHTDGSAENILSALGTEDTVLDLHRGAFRLEADFNSVFKKLYGKAIGLPELKELKLLIDQKLKPRDQAIWKPVLSRLQQLPKEGQTLTTEESRQFCEDLMSAFRHDYLSQRSGYASFVTLEKHEASYFSGLKTDAVKKSRDAHFGGEGVSPEAGTLSYRMKLSDLMRMAREHRIYVGIEHGYIEIAYPYNDSMADLSSSYVGYSGLPYKTFSDTDSI